MQSEITKDMLNVKKHVEKELSGMTVVKLVKMSNYYVVMVVGENGSISPSSLKKVSMKDGKIEDFIPTELPNPKLFFDNKPVVFEVEEPTIEHHGIKGQKHGVRKVPWYPIAEYLKSRKERKAKSAQEKENKEKISNMEPKALTPEEKQAKIKKDILDSGDLTLVFRNSDMFTDQEIQSAINRYNTMTNLKTAMEKQQRNQSAIASAVDFIDKNSATLLKAIDTGSKIINGADKLATMYVSLKDTKNAGGFIEKAKQGADKNAREQKAKDNVVSETQKAALKKLQDENTSRAKDLDKKDLEIEKLREELAKMKRG